MIVDYIKTCEFDIPVDSNGNVPDKKDPWQFSSETCFYTATSSDFYSETSTTSSSSTMYVDFIQKDISTTSDIIFLPYLTAGETINFFLMVIIIALMLGGYLASALNRISTKKTFLQYKGGDVEIRKDI